MFMKDGYMRRLAQLLLATAMIFAIFVNSIASMGHSVQPSSMTSENTALCSIACHNQSQIPTSSSIREQDDELEPTPPPPTWLLAPISLLTLYTVVFIVAYWIAIKQKRILLTTNMRF